MKLRGALTTLQQDVFAGVVVFLVALPLCLGIASASGVGPFPGLFAGIIGGLVVAALSGAPMSVSGPAAGLIVIVVEGMANVGGFEAFLTAVLLAGAMQFCFGLLKAGRFAAFVPAPVTQGMLAAIGLLLIIKQVPVGLGLADSSASAASHAMLDTPFGSISVVSAVITAVSLALLMAWDTKAMKQMRLVRSIPGPLMVVAIGIAATLLLDAVAPQFAPATEHRVMLPAVDSLPALFAAFSWPQLDQLTNPNVWRLAATLAIVASLETLLSLEALYQIDPKKRAVPGDRELKAQGVGNMLAGALGALPITSVIVRSSVNVNAGAHGRASALIHGVLLLASVFLLASVINLIPLASLAAILIATGIKLAKPSLFMSMARKGKASFAPFFATVVGVLMIDLLAGGHLRSRSTKTICS
jgi:MFS superfamily sulfate permease-like transporter